MSGDATVDLETAVAHGDLRVRRFALTVTEGPDAGTRTASEATKVVIGTHESADLLLRDDTISRFHCEVEIAGDRVVVRDLGSRNGTLLGGVSVIEAHAVDGATITIGRTRIRLDLQPDKVGVQLSTHEHFGTMVGRGVAMRRAFALLERAAASDAAVLLEGETGTGKEVAAESVHSESKRSDGPFVVVDCSAIPPDLLEAELFGHEKGAFTGAVSARTGAFEAASGGTVFLDEIGELSPALQPKLLRVLEKKTIKRVGSNTWQSVDVRVVAATNRNLRREVNDKRFRSDLYFRLAVVEVRLPPLRERPEDLSLLIERLLSGLDASEEDRRTLLAPDFLATCAQNRWSGNVRELRNYLERCIALRERPPLDEELPLSGVEGEAPAYDRPLKVARELWSRTFERRYVEELLRRHDGKVAAAAKTAGVDRMHFYRLLWRHGLR